MNAVQPIRRLHFSSILFNLAPLGGSRVGLRARVQHPRNISCFVSTSGLARLEGPRQLLEGYGSAALSFYYSRFAKPMSSVRTLTSASRMGVQPEGQDPIPDFKLLPTSLPTVFTCTPLDPSLVGFSRAVELQASELFSLPAAYVAPKDLNYQLPERGIPEIAFVGRSNVGKSTLVGTLLGDKSLVRISKSPGCTQNINYFSLNSRKYGKVTYMVDLPGYGYARASKEDRQKWSSTMEQFLNNRSFAIMRRVFLLVDSRRGISKSDETMMDMLNSAGLTYQIVLTKTDCVGKAELLRAVQSCYDGMKGRNRHACVPTIHAISAKEGRDGGLSGVATLKAEIASLVHMDFSSVVLGGESNSDSPLSESNINGRDGMAGK